MEYRLGRIDEKLDTLIESRDEERRTMRAHDRRIKALENWRWMIVGGALVIGFILKFV